MEESLRIANVWALNLEQFINFMLNQSSGGGYGGFDGDFRGRGFNELREQVGNEEDDEKDGEDN